jgi:hypothetical protein
MQKTYLESSNFVLRHELDRLAPTSAITAELATPAQLAELAAVARKEIPGVNASLATLNRFLRDDPGSIFAFQRRGELLGGIAFLYLNCRGHDALLLDSIDLKNPTREYLACPDEEVSAIYVWALAGHGRAVAGLGNVSAYLRGPRFVNADYFAQPSTIPGRDLLVALGFRRVPSFQPDLWCYERPWNRLPLILPAPSISPGSFAHARH